MYSTEEVDNLIKKAIDDLQITVFCTLERSDRIKVEVQLSDKDGQIDTDHDTVTLDIP